MDLFMMGTILGLGFLFLIGYEMNTKSKIKMAAIELEREKVVLEQRKLEHGEKS